MMSTYLPAFFGDNLLDAFDNFDRDFFRDFGNIDRILYGKHGQNLMKTDVKQTDNGYQVAVDLPGFKKDEIRLELNDGYLTISTVKSLDENREDENGRMLRQERFTGTMRRSFYVGDQLTEEDIHARFEDGVLYLSIPKKEVQALPVKRTICIE